MAHRDGAEAVGGNPSVVNYAMFTSVFAMLSLFYLIPATINEGFAVSPIILIVVDLLNTFFFLTCGIALAAELGAHSCSNHVSFVAFTICTRSQR